MWTGLCRRVEQRSVLVRLVRARLPARGIIHQRLSFACWEACHCSALLLFSPNDDVRQVSCATGICSWHERSFVSVGGVEEVPFSAGPSHTKRVWNHTTRS